ncbi:MAG: hypothetical protein KOO62_00430 [candidate division Zixibacteria bacterium]|nr:hypothetical protein [candidate division Zixibacteria bacterium]
MYNIEKKDYGYKLIFAGELHKDEMDQWLKESEQILSSQEGNFAVFVDMRKMQPASQVVQKFFQRGQSLYCRKGMERSAVILSSPALSMQFKRIAVQSGIFDGERYIDASTTSDWEEIGLSWVSDSIEPGSITRTILTDCR